MMEAVLEEEMSGAQPDMHPITLIQRTHGCVAVSGLRGPATVKKRLSAMCGLPMVT